MEILCEANPREFKLESVVLDEKGQAQEIPNDFVWIFAGGVPPYDFLKKIGVQFSGRDLTVEVNQEASRLQTFSTLPRSSRESLPEP